MLAYAAFWWNWPGGWLHRWGDQELWPFMLDVVNESSSVVEAADIRRTAFSNRSGCPYSSTALKGVQGSFSSRLV